MIRMMMMAAEHIPPVVVVYSVSPLYLRNLLVGNRSIDLKNL